jgi:hypothetical protein
VNGLDGPSAPKARSGVLRSVGIAGPAIEPFRFIAASWWLALVAIAVLQQAHDGLHEHLELPPMLHIIRDGALAVPAAALAVLAGLIAGHTVGRPGRSRIVERVVFAAVGAAAFAVLSVPGNQLHGALFGAEEEGVGFIADALLDGGLAFAGALLALIPFGLVIGPPAVAIQPLVLDPSRSTRGDVVARSSK